MTRHLVAGLLGIGLTAAGCTSGPPPPVKDERPYADRVATHRASKDQTFRSSAESPIPADRRASFTGLSYYPIDPTYRIPASLREDRGGSRQVIELPTSTRQIRRMARVGTLHFTVNGGSYALSAFASEDDGLNRLFVPFGDLTNNSETYGGGRYLELDRSATGLYDLDFNAAYNPFCVYNTTYDCPIPPAENRLLIAIRAGERLPEEHGG